VQIGVVFPQTEIGPDPGAVRAYAEAAVSFGYRHLLTYEHVLGADPRVHQDWSGVYDLSSNFHEPMVLFGWLAAFSPLELVTLGAQMGGDLARLPEDLLFASRKARGRRLVGPSGFGLILSRHGGAAGCLIGDRNVRAVDANLPYLVEWCDRRIGAATAV